jgi:hypothetical protein
MVRRGLVLSGVSIDITIGGNTVADWHAQLTTGSYTDSLGRVWSQTGTVVQADVPVGGVILDYEVPMCTSVLYRARATFINGDEEIAGSWVQSSPAVSWCPTQVVWLKDPNDPSINMAVDLVAAPSLERPRRQALYDVLGAEFPIARSDVLSSPRGTLSMCTTTKAEADALLALLGSSVLLLQAPEGAPGCPEVDGGWGSRYIAIGGVTESRSARLTRQHRVWTVPFVEVDSPADASL